MKISDLKNLDKDDVLGMLGLETRGSSSHLWTIGLIAIGALAGAAAALLLAPQSGKELRDNFGRKARETADDVMASVRTKVNDSPIDRE